MCLPRVQFQGASVFYIVILHLLPNVKHAVVSQALPIKNPCLLTCVCRSLPGSLSPLGSRRASRGAPIRWGLDCSWQPLASCVQTERVPLDLSPRLEEALDFGELEAEPSEGEDFEARGSRFSKSADERQRMLVQRKDDLLQQARR